MAPKIALAALLATSAFAAALPADNSILIVGGEKANNGDYPFIVSLPASGRHNCGGTLLNENTVLTAAHCGDASAAPKYKVRAGSLVCGPVALLKTMLTRWQIRDEGGKLVDVASITRHPEYEKNGAWDHDVAIWKLKEPIKEGDGIAFAKLNDAGKSPEAGLLAGVAGW